MKNKLLICIFAIFLGVLFVNRFVLQVVWVSPDVNTKVFPYISGVIKELDKALNYSIAEIKSDKTDAKIIYQNAYGSGFLKHNPIPNDLDYSVGVYLGEYEFNGVNNLEVAEQINKNMLLFQAEFYTYLNEFAPDKFYSNSNTLHAIQTKFDKRDKNIRAIMSSVPELFNHKDYVVYTKKKIYKDEHDPGTDITLPFILKKNEILIEDFSPITLFSNLAVYNKNSRDIIREITVITDYYADIKYKGEVVRAEIVPESFTGQRLQLTRRFFVPIIFVNNSSAKFLKHLDLLTDDEKYIEYRLFNFRRHVQEFINLTVSQDRPVKLLKRILQCTALISPALDDEIRNSIETTIEDLLNTPEVKLVNDFETAYSNLIEITSSPVLFNNTGRRNLMKHILEMKNMLNEMEKTEQFKKDDITRIKNYIDIIIEKLPKSEEDLKEYNKFIQACTDDVFITLSTNINDMLPNEVYEYIDIFNNIMKDAGFHRITIGWLNNNVMGVVKDDFTSKIPGNKLKDMAKQNNLIDTEYKLVNPSDLAGLKIRYSVWVRYNSTNEEDEVWGNLQEDLLKDKNNFRIKRKFVIPTAFWRKFLLTNNRRTDK